MRRIKSINFPNSCPSLGLDAISISIEIPKNSSINLLIISHKYIDDPVGKGKGKGKGKEKEKEKEKEKKILNNILINSNHIYKYKIKQFF
jgi:hypothetical protein